MFKIGILNGPNLNILEKRDQSIYGTLTLEEINQKIRDAAEKENIELMFAQSNSEGEMIDIIQKWSLQIDGLVINPAAYTHYSYAISDALKDCPVPVIEVHLSNIFSRDEFRQKSVTVPVCTGQIAGLGHYGYILAVNGLHALIRQKKR